MKTLDPFSARFIHVKELFGFWVLFGLDVLEGRFNDQFYTLFNFR